MRKSLGAGRDELVAHSAHGLNRDAALADFAADLSHMHVHGARFAVVVVASDLFQQLLTGEYDVLMFRQCAQEIELFGAER